MSNVPAVLLGAVAGGALTFAVLHWGGSREPAPASGLPPGAAQPSHGERPASPTSAAARVDLQPILDRLDRLTREVEALRAERVTGGEQARTRVAASPRSVSIDVDSLEQALLAIEERRLDGMSDKELVQKAYAVRREGGSIDDGIRVLEAALQRDLEPERRAEIATLLAGFQRDLKTPEGLAASENTLRAVVDEFGTNSRAGLSATYQLIWTASAQQDFDRAIGLSDAFLASPAATPRDRVNGRWAQAIMFQNRGDVQGARTRYEQLLRELDGQPEYVKLGKDIRARIDAM